MYIIDLLKVINGSFGSLLLLGTAIWALIYAIKEHRSKNRPYISTKVSAYPNPENTPVTIKLKNCGNQPAHLVVESLKTMCGQETVVATLDKEYFIPAGEEIEILAREFARSWCELYTRSQPKHEIRLLCHGVARSVYEKSVGARFEVSYKIDLTSQYIVATLDRYETKKL